MGREIGTSLHRVLKGPPGTLFGILSDTNRFDRISGVTPSTYTFELLDPKDPTSRTRIGHAKQGRIPIHFAEEGEYWCDSYLRGERQFRDGFARFFRRAFFEVTCKPQGEQQTKVALRVGYEPTWLGWLFVPYLIYASRKLLRRYLRSVEQVLATATSDVPADQPAAIQARYVLGSYHGEPTRVVGRRTRVSQEFEDRVARFRAAPVSPELREKLIELVTSAPDDAVMQIHPLELAARWQADGRELIRTFLHATRAGIFNLEWQVDCPTCRVGVDAVPRIDQVRGRIHCDECDISFDVEFDAHVHATFTVNPAVRDIKRVVYCATSPYFRPHLHGYARVEPGETRTWDALPDGDLLVRARGAGHSLTIARTAPTGVAVDVGDAGFRQTTDDVPERVLRVTNHSAKPIRLMVERAGWASPRARGSLIMTIPGFVDLFGTDAPATGLAMEVGRIAVLFTDLVGSVELYQRVGDAKAFALVQQHWRDVSKIVLERRGSVIKTLGDGVFAAFSEVDDAIAAALDIMAAAEQLSRQHGLAFAIRAGCHEGPCFIVRANDRVDLFGSTINLAARLSALAGGQQLALLSTLADPRTYTLTNDGHEVERTTSAIKGLPGEVAVALVTRKPSSGLPRLTRLRTDPIGLPTLRRPGSA
ncbi:MAG: adenylate/guanylate cyclase domain-containing protein [Deltaproteobacteria bacterium]|nr:adenylate/guanylate cyclase domain-containing protein [Deltaproteobacteria bacterium]